MLTLSKNPETIGREEKCQNTRPCWSSKMMVKVNESLIELVEGDITQQETDAIVNAAKSTLRGGGGLDGAVRSIVRGALKS